MALTEKQKELSDKLTNLQRLTVLVVGVVCFALMLPYIIGRIAADSFNDIEG